MVPIKKCIIEGNEVYITLNTMEKYFELKYYIIVLFSLHMRLLEQNFPETIRYEMRDNIHGRSNRFFEEAI